MASLTSGAAGGAASLGELHLDGRRPPDRHGREPHALRGGDAAAGGQGGVAQVAVREGDPGGVAGRRVHDLDRAAADLTPDGDARDAVADRGAVLGLVLDPVGDVTGDGDPHSLQRSARVLDVGEAVRARGRRGGDRTGPAQTGQDRHRERRVRVSHRVPAVAVLHGVTVTAERDPEVAHAAHDAVGVGQPQVVAQLVDQRRHAGVAVADPADPPGLLGDGHRRVALLGQQHQPVVALRAVARTGEGTTCDAGRRTLPAAHGRRARPDVHPVGDRDVERLVAARDPLEVGGRAVEVGTRASCGRVRRRGGTPVETRGQQPDRGRRPGSGRPRGRAGTRDAVGVREIVRGLRPRRRRGAGRRCGDGEDRRDQRQHSTTKKPHGPIPPSTSRQPPPWRPRRATGRRAKSWRPEPTP